jgi:hypothetical protein
VPYLANLFFLNLFTYYFSNNIDKDKVHIRLKLILTVIVSKKLLMTGCILRDHIKVCCLMFVLCHTSVTTLDMCTGYLLNAISL